MESGSNVVTVKTATYRRGVPPAQSLEIRNAFPLVPVTIIPCDLRSNASIVQQWRGLIVSTIRRSRVPHQRLIRLLTSGWSGITALIWQRIHVVVGGLLSLALPRTMEACRTQIICSLARLCCRASPTSVTSMVGGGWLMKSRQWEICMAMGELCVIWVSSYVACGVQVPWPPKHPEPRSPVSLWEGGRSTLNCIHTSYICPRT
jgi:hypothetical protein